MEVLGASMRVRQARSSVGQALGHNYLVLDLESGKYYGLGTVGGWVWRRLATATTLDELAAAMAERYGIGPEQARSDLLVFVNELLGHGLAEVVEPYTE